MSQKFLGDPKTRFAYVATKVAVFAVAAAITWPLSRVVGQKAWVGLGVFGFVLAILTIAVLSAGAKASDGVVQDPDVSLDDGDVPTFDGPVEIPLEDSIDLHSFPPRDVPDVVDAYLEAISDKGYSEVRLIHGRGIGLQRDRVQKLLAKHPLVSGFHDAPAERGGRGATIAYLKPKA